MVFCLRGIRVDEAWSGMQEDDISRILVCKMIECQTCQKGCMVEDTTNTPILVEIDVILINPGLFGAIEN